MTTTLTATPPLPPPPPAAMMVDLPKPGAWTLRWRGRTFSEADLTGQHLSTLALLSGSDDFENLDVDPRSGHQRLMQMLMAVVCVDRVTGIDPEAVGAVLAVAIDEIAQAPAEEILGALVFD